MKSNITWKCGSDKEKWRGVIDEGDGAATFNLEVSKKHFVVLTIAIRAPDIEFTAHILCFLREYK